MPPDSLRRRRGQIRPRGRSEGPAPPLRREHRAITREGRSGQEGPPGPAGMRIWCRGVVAPPQGTKVRRDVEAAELEAVLVEEGQRRPCRTGHMLQGGV
jgi:hypothetical protein